MIRKSILLIASAILLFSSCKDDRWQEIESSKLKNQNISFIDLDLSIYKFSKDNLDDIIHKNYNNNEILNYLFLNCLSIGNPEDSLFFKSIELFRKDKYIIDLENEIDLTLRGELSKYQVNLNHRFGRLSFFVKNKPIPKKIFWLNTLFSSSVFCSLNEIGVGLERYVGSSKNVIKKLPSEHFYKWMKDGMNKDYLERDILVNWIYTHYVPDNNFTLIEKMIQWGKIYYILYALDPDIPSNVILRYDNLKYDWCQKNEGNIWKYIVSQSLVFSKNERDISNFINEGPFTPGLPEKGPDRLGQYIGWKMVFNYMENHESKNLEDLLKTPYNSILQEYQIQK
jgi:hypothetical protein